MPTYVITCEPGSSMDRYLTTLLSQDARGVVRVGEDNPHTCILNENVRCLACEMKQALGLTEGTGEPHWACARCGRAMHLTPNGWRHDDVDEEDHAAFTDH